jgi:large subunit ribosomal protein L3
MKKCMMGKKIGMTQVFTDSGEMIPVSVILAGPLSVVQKKTMETDGYEAVKLGYAEIADRKANKPDKGQFKKAGVATRKYLREFKLENAADYKVGQTIKVEEMFTAGDKIDVCGISKGKGFSGTVKRWNTHRGPMSHGSGYHRGLGSMGAHSDPSRIYKGKGMPGHMGAVRVTVQNLAVVRVDVARGLLLVKGAVPGAKDGLLVIRDSVKA